MYHCFKSVNNETDKMKKKKRKKNSMKIKFNTFKIHLFVKM